VGVPSGRRRQGLGGVISTLEWHNTTNTPNRSLCNSCEEDTIMPPTGGPPCYRIPGEESVRGALRGEPAGVWTDIDER